jgi:hypothetical protein
MTLASSAFSSRQMVSTRLRFATRFPWTLSRRRQESSSSREPAFKLLGEVLVPFCVQVGTIGAGVRWAIFLGEPVQRHHINEGDGSLIRARLDRVAAAAHRFGEREQCGRSDDDHLRRRPCSFDLRDGFHNGRSQFPGFNPESF